MQIFHGDIIHSESWDKLSVVEGGYIAVNDNGLVEGVFASLPEQYAGAPVTDCGRGVIIPAFSDLHIHASQYPQRGTAMDVLLYDWLNRYTFPLEAKFCERAYAEAVYELVVQDLVRHGSFHASLFATIHRESTDILIDKMEKWGLLGYVGKVNMTDASPSYLCETVEQSLRETEAFLHSHEGAARVKPIITPRFAPTCNEELMMGLGKLAKRYRVGLQTHVVESRWEAGEALRCFPGYGSDSEIYERAGLLENGPAIFAHFIFPTEADIAIAKKYGVYTVHCPDATNNVIAGIMPAANLHEAGVALSMGSDVAGGHHIAVYRQIAKAVQLSKLKEFYEPECGRTILFENAFYMATKGGGSAFGNVGCFEKGYRFNALVLAGLEDEGFPLTVQQRLERFCYSGDERNIVGRYIDGKEVVVN